jgi:hypothetical protein
VGYYEQQQRPDDREKPPGCLDVLVITRAVFGVLIWPIAVMFAVVLDVGITFYLYTAQPLLALIPIAVTGGAVWAFTRWERRRYLPPDE